MIWRMTYEFTGWLPMILIWLARIAIALILLVVARKYVRRAREWITRILRDPKIQINLGESIPRIAGEIVYIILWVMLIATALVLLGVPATFVIGAVIILFALVVYALRESLSNLAATVIFVFFQPFRKGETIETLGQTGTVYDMEIFNTVLLASDQRLITLPNSEIQANGVINHTRMATTRIAIEFIVAYGEDIDAIRKAALEVMAQEARILADPAATVAVSDLNLQGIRMTASATVSTPERSNVPSDLRAALIKRLTAMQVHFPTPGASPASPS